MAEHQETNQDNFMIEKIKQRPINKRRLVRRTLITVSMAVIFGLIACFTFLVLEPVISNWLYPEKESEAIIFPEEPEEMLPEEMLEEYIQPSPSPSPVPEEELEPEKVELDESQIQDILNQVVLDMEDYRQIYSVLANYAKQLKQYMVVVTGTKSDKDWFANEYESKNETSGVVIGNNGKELLILTDYNSVKRADHLTVRFFNGVQADALMMQYFHDGNMAVLCISLNVLSQEMQTEDMYVAPLGSSLQSSLVGSPVIAMGGPMGGSGSVAYGIITDAGNQVNLADMNCQLLTTDIYGSQSANGVLFNTTGQVVGFITMGKTGSDMRNMISAYGISGLKQMISRLTKGDRIPYLGILGVDVPREANEQFQVPFGAYVREVEMDSPAMLAGIQSGDVIVGIDQQSVTKMSDYSDYLFKLNAEDTVILRVMRQSQEEYRELDFEITVGGAD